MNKTASVTPKSDDVATSCGFFARKPFEIAILH